LAGAVIFTLWLGWGSVSAKTWWPVLWFVASFMGLGTGMLFGEFAQPLAPWWWSLWLAYLFVLPIMRWIRKAPRDPKIYGGIQYTAEQMRALRQRYHVEE